MLEPITEDSADAGTIARAKLDAARTTPSDADYPLTCTKCGSALREVWETFSTSRLMDRAHRSACPKRGKHKA